MVNKSLEKLLVDGKEIKVVATHGSIIDEKYTTEALLALSTSLKVFSVMPPYICYQD